MTKQEMKKELNKMPIKRLIGILQILSLIVFCLTPIICIWHSFKFGLKIGLTTFISMLILYFFDYILKEAINRAVEQYEEK